MKSLAIILSTIICTIFISGCGKDDVQNTLPVSAVYFKLDLNNQDILLKTPTKFIEYKTPRLEVDRIGYGGLLVVNSIYSGETPILLAYDLSCPNERISSVRVKASTNGTATCEKCGRVYDLMADGIVKSDKSKPKLQMYRVSPSVDQGVFYVRN